MASKTRSEIMPLGPGTLTLDGIGAGYTEELKVMVELQDTEGTAGDYGGDGGTPLDIFHKATRARIEVILDQVNLAVLQKAMQGSTRTTSGADEKLSFGQTSGERQTAQELIFTPLVSALSTNKVLKAYRVVPRDSREIAYNNDQQKTAVVFECLIDEGRSNNDRLFAIGTQSVAIDSTAPTLSSSNPADDATGVAVSVSPALTFSKGMDPSTLNSRNIMIFEAGETGAQTPVAVASFTMSSNDTVVTLDITSNLTAGTEYNIIIGPGCKDAAGNAFAGTKISFTTAP